MKRHAVAAASVRLAASVAALTLIAPVMAGDRALIDFIGFSEDGQYFAFEEFGIEDGSGFPYANIYVLDLSADKWVANSPIRVRLEDDGATGNDARAEAAEQAQPILDELGIDAPADLIAINADGEPGDATTLAFAQPGYFPNDLQGAFELALETFDADSPMPCADYSGEPAKGLALTLTTGDGEPEEIYRDAEMLPESRGCPSVYRLYAVVAPPYSVPTASHVAIIATYPFGFEGPDRRFIAIPLPQ